MEGRVELMLKIGHSCPLRRSDNDARHDPDVRRELPRPNGVFGDEPEEIGILEEAVERSADLSAQPLARCGQAFANEFGVCYEQAVELTRIAGIDGGNRAVKEPVEISVGHFW
jgi:hypothetical protein